MEFKDRLKALLDERQMKPVDLARDTGLSESIVSYYLSGKKEPMGKTCFKIAKALDITVDELLETPFANQDKARKEQENARKSLSETAKKICSRLRETRLKKGFTQEQIALHLGIKTDTYAAYERLVSEPSIDTVYILCQFYGESFDDWLGLEKDKPNAFGIDAETGEFIPQLENSDVADILKDVMELPEEALGELRYSIEFLKYKYKKG